MFQPLVELERKIRFNLSLGFWEVDRVVVNGCQKSEEGEERIVQGPRISSRIGSPHRRFHEIHMQSARSLGHSTTSHSRSSVNLVG